LTGLPAAAAGCTNIAAMAREEKIVTRFDLEIMRKNGA
jgi:hypothetical protein